MMHHVKQVMLVSASLTVVVAAAALVLVLTPAGDAAAAGMKALLVEVVNTPYVSVVNQPLGVEVGNAPDVSVINQPNVQASQSGAWNVGVTGAVQVGNSPADAIPVRDVELPASTPFSESGSCVLDDGQTSCQSPFDLPPGQRFVVELFSVHASIPIGQSVGVSLQTMYGTPLEFSTVWLPLQVQYTTSSPAGVFSEYMGVTPVRLYADAQPAPNLASLLVSASRGEGSGSALVQWVVTGYLVDCGRLTNACSAP